MGDIKLAPPEAGGGRAAGQGASVALLYIGRGKVLKVRFVTG